MRKLTLLSLLILLISATTPAEEGMPLEGIQQETAYFLSSSIPEKTLVPLLKSAQAKGIPVYFNGLIDNSMEKTARYLLNLIQKYQVAGIQVDPLRFDYYGITQVPALVKRCGKTFDIVYGSVALEEGLTQITRHGACRDE
ncbi:type-F conjugative transfer system pilin assembly protein TrbC [Arsenophonus nasoniae]|uniref:Type-F conjugative transfer system pilin assembly protein TrbC n=2 Tax=Arsenophonus nasoniae TaxID=638 RepID=A0AA95KEQ3_9GAMM|nr:type-F conjugative transfer system pilin assembly protein TrbC [Arsenophonus nasoniae]WGM03303.1 type-F conjugative transfer system pilin assembly protein TrbC [Arsenophonus nasoniae]WGM03368.1 type-F conjugative transfer system pilin assembly protein TrbC [Arsenophonus nasoniae]